MRDIRNWAEWERRERSRFYRAKALDEQKRTGHYPHPVDQAAMWTMACDVHIAAKRARLEREASDAITD